MKKRVLGAVFAVMMMGSSSQAVQINEGKEPVDEYANSLNSSASIPPGQFALIAHYADAFLSAKDGPGGHRTIYAEALMDGEDDPELADEITDFYLLDIRRPGDYAAGHIAGAVNVQFGEVADPGVLAMLPRDMPILVICYTGHTASIANAILGTLGYDAWTLRFGMTSWKKTSPTAVWSPDVKQDIVGGDYSLTIGAEP